jgi:hypothetical protein
MAILGTFTLTNCSSIPDFMPTGSIMTFLQAASPTSWTRVTSDSADNRMLRVVNSGNGGGVGGSASPILNNVVPTHTHGFTTGNVSSDHSHGVGDPGHTHTLYSDRNDQGGFHAQGNVSGHVGARFNRRFDGSTFWIEAAGTGVFLGGISANHTHSGTTDNGSSQTNWAPRYIDTLLCSKN